MLIREVLPDVRLALRLIRRQPAFTTVVVLTLALGIGATASIFNVLDAMVLQVMHLPDGDRLLMVSEATPSMPFDARNAAPANFLDWRAEATVFDYMGAFDWNEVNLASTGGAVDPERVGITAMSAGLLEILGAIPQAGRLVDAVDEPHGAARVAVLSHGLWHRRFGGDPDVLGRTLLLDEVAHTIVGVADPDFSFPRTSAVWTALSLTPEMASERHRELLSVVARLRPGTTLAAARAELSTINARLQAAYPDSNASVTIRVDPLRAAVRDEAAPAMVLAWQVAAVLVLLIGCINVAQLLLAQGRVRQREFSMRVALGAGLGRVVRQLVIEGLVLSALAAAASLVISWFALRALKASMPPELARYVAGWDLLGVDFRLVIFTCAVAAVAALAFSVLPAIQAARVDLNDTLKQGGRSAAGHSGGTWGLHMLVVAEIAGALMLTTATALTIKGASALVYGYPGYDATQVLNATVSLPANSYQTADARRQFFDRALERLVDAPGIATAALVNSVPAGFGNASRSVLVEGEVTRDTSDLPAADYRAVSADYFEALRIPIVQGRGVLLADGPGVALVAVVSKAFASRFWPGLDPIGRRFRTGIDGPWITVVGVSGDIVHHWFARRNYPTFYVPYLQDPRPVMSFVVRTRGEPVAAAPLVREVIAAIDPHLPLFDVQSLEHMRSVNVTGLTYLVRVMTIFGTLAVLLAGMGIYAVMAYTVTRERREMGVRLALGAEPRAIVRLAGERVVRLTGAGVVLGLVGAFGLGKLLVATLFGLVSLDLPTFAIVTIGLSAVALTAGVLPVRHALRIDPATTLRAE